MSQFNNYDYSILTDFFPESVIEEFKASAINPLLCLLNADFLNGDKAIAELLSNAQDTHDNKGSLRKKYRDTYAPIISDGGTSYTGIDIESNCVATCMTLKPATPRTSKDGKVIKYENPLKTPCTAFYPIIDTDTCKGIFKRLGIDIPASVGVEREWSLEQIVSGKVDGVWEWKDYCIDLSIKFWQWIIDNPKACTVLTEGCKKTLSGIGTGEVCMGLSGIWNGTPNDTLLPSLKLLAVPDRVITIAFDEDTKESAKHATYAATSKLSKPLLAEGCRVCEAKWDGEIQGKGIDDLIATCGVKVFHKVITKASQIKPPATDNKNSKAEGEEPKKDKEKYVTPLELAKVATYFHTADKVAYADISIEGNRHTYAVESRAFKLWLSGESYKTNKVGIVSQSFKDTLPTLEAMAIFDGECRKIHLRVAESQDKLYSNSQGR